MISWPDTHVHWQGIIPAAPEYSVPFAVHVFIFKTREQLRQAVEDPEACAHSRTFTAPDPNDVGALLTFSIEDLHVSLAAHESAHVALAHHGHNEQSRISARRWLNEHPESVAEMTGNLTAFVWAALNKHGSTDG